MKTIDELLNEFAVDSGFEDYLDYQNSLTLSDGEWMEICEKYAEQFKPKWIPVQERMPEEEGEYLICDMSYNPPLVYSSFCQFHNGEKNFYSTIGDSVADTLTHWMNLPEPLNK